MKLTVTASADTYITNRVIKGEKRERANLGLAGTLDLFKLYGYTSTQAGTGSVPNLELSRLLLKFPIAQLSSLPWASSSFRARLIVKDIYGGQTTPDSYSILVCPLSKSWDEGRGRDIALFNDVDSCNYVTASINGGIVNLWNAPGAFSTGSAASSVDRIIDVNGTDLSATQQFVNGDEDLNVDVTNAVSATLANQIPDSGFCLAMSPEYENDDKTYFVKRFYSRHTQFTNFVPKLVVSWDDSLLDDSPAPTFDAQNIFVHKHDIRGRLSNFVSSSSSPVAVAMRLQTRVSGSTRDYVLTGSRFEKGIYVFSGTITLDQPLQDQLQHSGSVTFQKYLQSIDGTVGFATGTSLTFRKDFDTNAIPTKNVYATVTGVPAAVSVNSLFVARCFIDDLASRTDSAVTRQLRQRATVLYRDVHYSIRQASSSEAVVDVDTVTNSTRLSNDSGGYYFRLPTSCLVPGNAYEIDVYLHDGAETFLLQRNACKFAVIK